MNTYTVVVDQQIELRVRAASLVLARQLAAAEVAHPAATSVKTWVRRVDQSSLDVEDVALPLAAG